jgi:hypothetical protein
VIFNRAYRRLTSSVRPTAHAAATVRATTYWTRLDTQQVRGWWR